MEPTRETKVEAMRAAGDVHPTIFVDGEPHRVEGPTMTGAELLALAGLSTADATVYAEGHHGQIIRSDQIVPVQDGGRFHTHQVRAGTSAG